MARKPENPQDYKGPRTAIRSKGTKCGWCISNDCAHCKHEVAYYEKLWICSCTCNDNWIPQDVGTGLVEEKKNDKRGTSGEDDGPSDDDGSGDSVAIEETPDDESDDPGLGPEYSADDDPGDGPVED